VVIAMRFNQLLFAASLLGCGNDTSPGMPIDAGAGSDAGSATGSACQTSVVASPGTVITTTGPVTGVLAGGVYAWKGIPYAAPPTGALRWQPPQPAACWTDALSTTTLGAECPQLGSDGSVEGDESCLTLNVWAPSNATNAPVMVFIHGGGNTQGSASDPVYDGSQLAANAQAVVVTIEYRLGALGFFANAALDAESPHQTSGNYGILDQIAALQWVKSNIAGFGGAPDHVLLIGESAGAQDTFIHVASPLSSGLFAAALAESGGSYNVTLAQNETAMQAVVNTVGCGSASDVAACMRAVPAATLAAIPSAVGPLDPGMRYVPSIDGYLLSSDVPSILLAGTQNAVPFIVGTNGDETSRMVPTVTTDTQYESAVDTLYGSGAGSALLALYPASSYASPQAALVAVTTDVTWTCPIRYDARLASAHQPIYRYHFTWSAPGAAAAYGAFHGIELPFVFDTFSAEGFTPSGSDSMLSSAMEGYFSSLAATGNPNSGAAIEWPAYDASTDPYLQLDTPIAAGSGLETTLCNALDKLEGR
jgi:para-nitrobenzyl esterase